MLRKEVIHEQQLSCMIMQKVQDYASSSLSLNVY